MSEEKKGLLKIKIDDGIVNNCEISVDGVKLDCVTKIVIHPMSGASGYVEATLSFEKVILDLAIMRSQVEAVVEDMIAETKKPTFWVPVGVVNDQVIPIFQHARMFKTQVEDSIRASLRGEMFNGSLETYLKYLDWEIKEIPFQYK